MTATQSKPLSKKARQGVAKEPVSASQCDRCGEIVTDLDAGFSPGRHAYGHDCGGTWRIVGEVRQSSAE